MVHTSPFAGQWYPSDPTELRGVLSDAFEKSHARTAQAIYPNALGFVVPHAAPVYSGAVAASVYRHLERQRPARIVLLGFSHHHGHDGVCMPSIDVYRTPLGDIPVDRAAEFRPVAEERVCDHSIEIQLPFLQTVLKDFSVVPLYVGRLDAAERERAGRALARLLDGRTVFLASSDFTHYGRSFGYQPFPLNSETPEKLDQLDRSVMDAASSIDPDVFLSAIRKSGSTMCGYNPVALLLETMKQAQIGDEVFQRELDYETSGEITGEYSHCVSYGALGYFPASSFLVDPADQIGLLSAAHATLDRFLETGRRDPVPADSTPALSRPASAFVTVYQRGHLRGCIGRLHDEAPLRTVIPQLTLSAALDDPRFAPVHRGDTSLTIEVSVLTPTKRIASPDAMIVNEHGGLIENGHHRGLLLPKVAGEHGMNREQFLAALAKKAGLPPDIYAKPDTLLRIFRAQVFGDRSH